MRMVILVLARIILVLIFLTHIIEKGRGEGKEGRGEGKEGRGEDRRILEGIGDYCLKRREYKRTTA